MDGSPAYGPAADATFLAVVEVRFRYDAEGNRIERTEQWRAAVSWRDEFTPSEESGPAREVQATATTTRYLVDRGHVWATLNGQNQYQSRFVYGDQVDQVLARQDYGNAKTYWYLTDRQGSVGKVVDASDGSAVKTLRYEGVRGVARAGTLHDSFEYTGREVDQVVEAQYNRARWLDTWSGRFLSEDSWGFAAGDTNLYRYAGNSWPNATDPSGHFWTEIGDWAGRRIDDFKEGTGEVWAWGGRSGLEVSFSPSFPMRFRRWQGHHLSAGFPYSRSHEKLVALYSSTR